MLILAAHTYKFPDPSWALSENLIFSHFRTLFLERMAEFCATRRNKDRDFVIPDLDVEYMTFIEKKRSQVLKIKIWLFLGDFWLIFRKLAIF